MNEFGLDRLEQLLMSKHAAVSSRTLAQPLDVIMRDVKPVRRAARRIRTLLLIRVSHISQIRAGTPSRFEAKSPTVA
jgi:hypothetical protein